MVNGHTVRVVQPPLAYTHSLPTRPPAIPRAPAHPSPPPLPTTAYYRLCTLPLILSSSQARPWPVLGWDMCASCKPVNGMLPADSSWCFGHGTHVASTVGGRNFGVAKEVTIVPVSSCPRFFCASNRKFECFSEIDMRANLECAPRHTCAATAAAAAAAATATASAAPPPPPPPPATHSVPPLTPSLRPCSHRRSPSLLQVGAYRLRKAPQSALRNYSGYTQRRHPSRHLARSTLGYG